RRLSLFPQVFILRRIPHLLRRRPILRGNARHTLTLPHHMLNHGFAPPLGVVAFAGAGPTRFVSHLKFATHRHPFPPNRSTVPFLTSAPNGGDIVTSSPSLASATAVTVCHSRLPRTVTCVPTSFWWSVILGIPVLFEMTTAALPSSARDTTAIFR